ncbi:MAG: hypothetical protein U0736_25355 [Gemmataceae bacterium]
MTACGRRLPRRRSQRRRRPRRGRWRLGDAGVDEVAFEEEQRVGGYRLLERLGRRGRVVYRAEQVAVGRPVAVKLLHAVADASDRGGFGATAAGA